MSAPVMGGNSGGGGDLFGNLFGGGQKQVYPPAPPGYKYVDLNIPQAPPGYTVAKMSSIANNQSTPTGTVTSATLGGNAGLGLGQTGRTRYTYGAHTAQGIQERALQAQRDRNQLLELRGLRPDGTPINGPPGTPPNLPAVAAATQMANAPTGNIGVNYTRPPVAPTTQGASGTVPPALVTTLAAAKGHKFQYPKGTLERAQEELLWKAQLDALKQKAAASLGMDQGAGGSLQDQINKYLTSKGATPPTAPPTAPPVAPPTAVAPPVAPPVAAVPPSAPPVAAPLAIPPTQSAPNAPPAAPPPTVAAPTENIPNLGTPPVGSADQPSTWQSIKNTVVPQVLKDFWTNMTSPPTPAFDTGTATINDQRYIPIPDDTEGK